MSSIRRKTNNPMQSEEQRKRNKNPPLINNHSKINHTISCKPISGFRYKKTHISVCKQWQRKVKENLSFRIQ